MGPHDKLFKRVFSNPENAIVHFESFLPAEITAALDLSRAEHVPGSWVDEVLREHHSDVLYMIPTRASSEGLDKTTTSGALLYCLTEHQSTVNPQMALKLLRYVTRVLDQWSREHPGQKLPPVLPMVLYHGKAGWTAARDLDELFDLGGFGTAALEVLRPYLPKLRYMLDEVRLVPDERLPGHGIVRLTKLMFKHGSRPEIIELLPQWEAEFRVEVSRGETGLQNLAEIVEYLLKVNEHVSVSALTEFMAPMGDEAKEIPMTVGEQLIEKGRLEGEAKGRRQNQLEVARRLLARGMSPAEVADATDLPLEEVQKLTH